MSFLLPNRPLVCLVALLGISVSRGPAIGQENAPADDDQIHAVFRISKAFLAEVTDRPIAADIPFTAAVLKFQCGGVIHGEGTMSIDLLRSGQQAIFEVRSQGHGHACVRGVRGPIVAHGTAWGPFTSRTLVRFDGRRFTHVETVPDVSVCADVRRITGRHDRRIGRLIGSGMLPMTDKLIPRATAQATPIAEAYLKEFVEETADKITFRLNQRTPIEESVNRLFPRTQNWVFQMSSDQTFLQAAYGPPGADVPDLPGLTSEMPDVRLEVWLRSTGQEAKLLAAMSRQPLAKQLVQKHLEAKLPELAALAERRSVDAVGPWVVLRIGTPESSGTLQLAL